LSNKQKLTFVQKKKQAIKGEAKGKALAATSYRELLRSLRNMHAKTAKINVPILYKLLRNQGLKPDQAREKLTSDCWFWSDRWIREFLPEEAKRSEMVRIKKDHEDAKKEIADQQYPDDDMRVQVPPTDYDRDFVQSEGGQAPLVLEKGEKAIMAKTILQFNPVSNGLYIFPRSNGLIAMLRMHPEIEQEMIEDIELTHDGTRITDVKYTKYQK
jgi:hypothetical protein